MSSKNEIPHGENDTKTDNETKQTDDNKALSTPLTKSTIIFALCAAINSCNLGYAIGVSTNAGVLVQNHFQLSDIQRGLFVGSINLWAIFGSFFAHWMCDRYGRHHSFRVATVGFIVGLVIMAAANGYVMLMLGRILVGLGVGFGLAVSTTYGMKEEHVKTTSRVL